MAVSETSPERLRTRQYRDASNLEARIALHQGFSVNQQGWPAWLFGQLETLGLPPDARLLELGSGAATLWREAGARVPSGWQIRLSDFSRGCSKTRAVSSAPRPRASRSR